MKIRQAVCACGRLSVSCAGEPLLVSLCHCLQCQRRTGSAFGLAAFFDRQRITVDGEAGRYARQAESGFDVLFHFCEHCGSVVYWEPRRKPDAIAVAVGCFADPGFPAPSKAVFEEHRHPWVTVST